MLTVLCFACVFFGVHGREFLDEEYAKLPRLFNLDDYHECLAKPDGLYCLATFELTPEQEDDPTYHLMKEYSKEAYAFNRTVIHRGYCVSAQCPYSSNITNILNNTVRLEECANKLAHTYGMKTSIRKLHYCRSYKEANDVHDPDLAQAVYLSIVSLIILLNISGTAYDVMTKDNPKKINILLSWSIRSNWNELIKTDTRSSHQPLAAIHGIRVAVGICTCIIHSAILYYTLYHYDPRVLEQITRNPLTIYFQNSTAFEQMFVVLTSFFCVHTLRRPSKNLKFSFGLLLKLMVKRIFRISPLYLIVIGFMATWWPYLNDGPLWLDMAIAESKICREKFFIHATFLHNIVDPEKICVLPTWYLGVDIQMYFVAVTLTLVLARFRTARAIIVLSFFLVCSIIINGVLAYRFEWKSMVYFTTVTEDIHRIFRDIPSFNRLYITPWCNLSACIVGLIMGHLYPAMLETNFSFAKYKWVFYISYLISVPSIIGWQFLGHIIKYIQNKTFVALYAAVENPLYQIIILFVYVEVSVIKSFVIRIFAWRGWQPLARLSMSVMLIHWCINLIIMLPSPQPTLTSGINILTVGVATALFTFILSVPLTILVEMPMIKFYDVISST